MRKTYKQNKQYEGSPKGFYIWQRIPAGNVTRITRLHLMKKYLNTCRCPEISRVFALRNDVQRNIRSSNTSSSVSSFFSSLESGSYSSGKSSIPACPLTFFRYFSSPFTVPRHRRHSLIREFLHQKWHFPSSHG